MVNCRAAFYRKAQKYEQAVVVRVFIMGRSMLPDADVVKRVGKEGRHWGEAMVRWWRHGKGQGNRASRQRKKPELIPLRGEGALYIAAAVSGARERR